MQINRIKSAGESAMKIYYLVLAQFIVGLFFGVLYKYPQVILNINFNHEPTNFDNEISMDRTLHYFSILNLSFGVVEFVLLILILKSLKNIATNLLNADKPLNTSSNSNNKNTEKPWMNE